MLDRVADVSWLARQLRYSRQPEAAVLLEMLLARGFELPADSVDEACHSAHVDTIALLLRRGIKATSRKAIRRLCAPCRAGTLMSLVAW